MGTIYSNSEIARKLAKSKWLLVALVLLWIVGVGAGIRSLLAYSNTPGPLSAAPPRWPLGTEITSRRDGPRLVIFVHPHCPCSRATIGELARIMARSQGKVEAYVVFPAPRSQSREWVTTDLWQSAAAIPGVRVIADEDGKEVRRFGALTSGQALLYDARGRLLFKGGITVSRGHEGGNDGAEAVLSFIQSGTASRKIAAVFGCSLRDESQL